MNLMCINIINSNSPWYKEHSHSKDVLFEKEWIEWFLKKWGFPVELSENNSICEQLADLRTLLTEAVDTIIAGKELPQGTLRKMNRYFTASAMVYEVKAKDQQYLLNLAPIKCDWNYILCEITASFVRLLAESDITRLKRCENPDCRSVFYDSSKNLMRKWCCNTCSSLIKVRRYRDKQKGNLI